MAPVEKRTKLRRMGRWAARLAFVLFSVAATLVGLGAPGVGWVLEAVILTACSVFVQVVGRPCLGLCLAFGVLQAVWIGPLADVSSAAHGNLGATIAFVVVPLGVALATLLAPLWMGHKAGRS